MQRKDVQWMRALPQVSADEATDKKHSNKFTFEGGKSGADLACGGSAQKISGSQDADPETADFLTQTQSVHSIAHTAHKVHTVASRHCLLPEKNGPLLKTLLVSEGSR